jgi:hypothetical protein
MFLVLKDHFNRIKGQLLFSHFESSRDARRIYCKLKEHAMRLPVVQLLVDNLSGIRMNDPNEKELFGKTFDDVWKWN